MGLVDTIDNVAELLGRPMQVDELVILGRMHRAGKSAKEIASMIGERPEDVSDEDVPVKRAEVAGVYKRRAVFKEIE